MAKQIENLDGPAWTPATDWSKYGDGKAWELTRGEDFIQTTRQARAAFHKWAQRNSLGCRIVVVDDVTLRVQTFPRDA